MENNSQAEEVENHNYDGDDGEQPVDKMDTSPVENPDVANKENDPDEEDGEAVDQLDKSDDVSGPESQGPSALAEAEDGAAPMPEKSGAKTTRTAKNSRRFAARSRKTHQEYSMMLDVMKTTSWMSVHIQGMVTEQKFGPQDLFISNETILRQLHSWATNQDVHIATTTFQLLYRLLEHRSVVQDLSEECQMMVRGSQDKNLEVWMSRPKPPAFPAWKTRLLNKFPGEKTKLNILLTDELFELEQRVQTGIRASIVALKYLQLSATHDIVSLVIPDLLRKAKEIAFSGYVTTPKHFVLRDEFCETVLQNQLALKQASTKKADIPSLELPVPMTISIDTLQAQSLAAMTDLSAQLRLGFDMYEICKAKMLDDIVRAPPGEHSTHTTVRSWIEGQMSREAKAAYPVLRAFSPLVTRVVKAIGAHFNTPVAGKHPISIKFRNNVTLIGTRLVVSKEDSDATMSALERKIHDANVRLEAMRARLQRQKLAQKKQAAGGEPKRKK
jgi:hypothetical protein